MSKHNIATGIVVGGVCLYVILMSSWYHLVILPFDIKHFIGAPFVIALFVVLAVGVWATVNLGNVFSNIMVSVLWLWLAGWIFAGYFMGWLKDF